MEAIPGYEEETLKLDADRTALVVPWSCTAGT